MPWANRTSLPAGPNVPTLPVLCLPASPRRSLLSMHFPPLNSLSELPPHTVHACFHPLLQKLIEREEREKRRAEAAKEKEDARRYPMEDLELLQELRDKAAEAGECCISGVAF